MENNSSALSDVKILDFSHLLAGPFATQILGDYGAEVFKIERIHVGDDFRRWNFFNKKVGNQMSSIKTDGLSSTRFRIVDRQDYEVKHEIIEVVI